MPLLLNNAFVQNDPWTLYGDEQALPEQTEHTIVSLERYLQQHENNETLSKGVSLAPDDNTYALAPHINLLELICLQFPAYTDGRGYSHARLLRKRFAYQGELRAVGDIRADQLLFMNRTGINAFDSDALPDAELLHTVLARFEHNYQVSYPLP